jgi:acetoin utilization protein AcuB
VEKDMSKAEIPTVAEVMTRNPVTVAPEAKLGDMLRLMRTHGWRHLPVMQAGDLIGIVSDRDIRLALNSPVTLHDRGEDDMLLETVTAEGCMTHDPMTIRADAPATEAADLMLTYQFSSLPVMREGALVGIITVSDLLRSYIKLAEALAE